jgi:uncharacterized protein (DUF2141 family)
MGNDHIKNLLEVICGLMMSVGMYSCANIASPTGGPYDETPPKYVSSLPAPNEKNYKGKKVEILFDELVQLDKPSENVIITPPQMQLPVIRSAGKKVVVELKDSLKENMTYTIDFTNSISDNNESNVFENFSFAFSTGDVIDTMEVSGVLLSADNLEPMQGITIGLHKNLEDSAFVKLPFDRTSRTNDKGAFTIRNISPGSYRIYALNDVNRDYKFDQAGEDIAFCDSIIIPSQEPATRQDTIWKDSLTIDTIQTVAYTRYLPDDILLRLFKENFVRQYLLKPERKQENLLTVRFNAPLDTIPLPKPLNFSPEGEWYFIQKTEEGRGVNFWLTDSLVWKQDTLRVELCYPKSDSLNILRPQTDTLQFVMRRRPEKKKKKKDEDTESTVFLGTQVEVSATMDLFDTISVTFSEPVLDLDKEAFHLSQMVDSVSSPVDFNFFRDSVNTLNYFILRKWKYGEEYKLTIDSATIHSLYGKWNEPYSSEFKIKQEDEYGHLYLNIVGIDTTAYVELLNNSDAPVRKAKVKNGGALFMDLKPDGYYARLVVDLNGNGEWDTGCYAEKRQPEEVYYSPVKYNVMKNWQVEETWQVKATPLIKQKPLEITKNKPKEATKKKRDYKEEAQKKSSSRSSSNSMGLPF